VHGKALGIEMVLRLDGRAAFWPTKPQLKDE